MQKAPRGSGARRFDYCAPDPRPSNTKFQMAGDFLDQNRPLNGLRTPGRVLARRGNKIVLNLFQVAGAAHFLV